VVDAAAVVQCRAAGPQRAPREGVAAAILLSIAGIVLFLYDLSEARSRKAFDRIFEEGNRRRR
jgi:hypothetical protein